MTMISFHTVNSSLVSAVVLRHKSHDGFSGNLTVMMFVGNDSAVFTIVHPFIFINLLVNLKKNMMSSAL